MKYINKSLSLINNSLIKNINPKYSQSQKKQFGTFSISPNNITINKIFKKKNKSRNIDISGKYVKNPEEDNARAKKIVFKKEIKPSNIKSNIPKIYFFYFSKNQLDSFNNSINNNYQMNQNYSKDS